MTQYRNIIVSLSRTFFALLFAAILLTGCGSDEPLTAERYKAPDALFSKLEANVLASNSLEKIVEIDHSRLGKKAGSKMPPARVLIFSNPRLEAELMARNPLVGIDLPLRALAYESVPGGNSKVIYNSFEYIKSRYDLNVSAENESAYNASMSEAIQGIGPEQMASFTQDSMNPDGITTIDSPYDFPTTIELVMAGINSQDDTVSFGSVDFQKRSEAVGIAVKPATLILFGGPAPGAKAMKKAPTLGLDAFCQKFLVWQDENNKVHLSFNDLLDVAERQDVGKSIALRVINYRLNKVFEEALNK